MQFDDEPGLKSARVYREVDDRRDPYKDMRQQQKKLMNSGQEKGVIQRVLDYIYENFRKREDLYENAELKITFLEIYNDSVTDLLDKKLDSPELVAKVHGRKEPTHHKAFNMSRRSSLSSLDNDHKPY